ncbi:MULTISPECIES: hypothetical protein [unclassified Rhizobium]|uniref:hypothetical protein n=1 Tax=unclassified Rhizobium TaxID=2613769 RepID=UPI0038305C11
MAGRPPKEKSFANMLNIAIKAATETGGSKLRAVADALIAKAITGDVAAIKEVADRLDGKVAQTIPDDPSNPLHVRSARDLTDDELAIIAAGGSIGASSEEGSEE